MGTNSPNGGSPLDDYKDIIIDCYVEGMTAGAIARFLVDRYNVSTSDRSIRRAIERWDSEIFSFNAEKSPIAKATRRLQDEQTEEDMLRDELVNANKELVRINSDFKHTLKMVKEYEKVVDDQDRVAKRIIQAMESNPYEPVFRVGPSAGSGDDPHTMFALISDAHYGETVDMDIFGIQYNMEIAERRIKYLTQKIIRFREIKSAEYPINKIVVAFLGDMISGNIHEELAESNESPVSDQLVRMAHIMVDVIGSLSEVFPEVEVIVMPGNHPRLSKKPRHKRKYDNLEYIMGEMVKAIVKPIENVEVIVPKDLIYIHDIMGHKVGMTHGDGYKSTSFAGIPFYGLARKRAAFQEGLKELGMPLVDMLVMGHFHQLLWWPGRGCDLIVNGSIKGPDEYAFDTMHAGDEAQQALITMNRKHGITSFERINLGSIQ
jgi:predicted phosphodiesterase